MKSAWKSMKPQFLFHEMTESTKGILQAYLAIFLGTVIGFGLTKVAGDAMDRRVLETCHPSKIYSYPYSVFGDRLLCK